MRANISCILLALLAWMPAAAFADGPSLGMSFVETKDLRIIYFDELDYLVPHAVSTATNSMAWQRRTFGWVPSESTAMLLMDFSDYGSGAAVVAPRNRLFANIAPISHAFETYPASERMYSLMNHELVHVATGDIASEEELRWRRIFLGKVYPQAAHPESLLYSYLTVPRFTTPRWYLEGSAVFMETWMAGGLGRAQGGYDEMVFRAMVRDNAHFYDPLGLVSRGVRVDFQIGANAYLYGTRFFTYLAYVYSPEKVIAWLKRDEGSERYYADNFRSVFGIPLEQGMAGVDHIRARNSSEGNLAEVRKYPITPHRTLAASAIGSISRMYYDEASGNIYAAFRYPGFVEHVGALNTRDGSAPATCRHQARDAVPRSFLRLRPGDRHRVLHERQSGASRSHGGGRQDRRVPDAARGCAHRRDRLQPGRSLFDRRAPRRWALPCWCAVPYPYTDWQALYTFPYEACPLRSRHLADGKLLSASMSEVNADQFLRVWELDKVLKGDDEAA